MAHNLEAVFGETGRLLRATPGITLNEISHQLGVERHSIQKSVQLSTGLSFKTFKRNIQMDKAAKLLINSNLGIKAIAYDMGFRSRHAFSRSFKAVHGVNPSQYRAAPGKSKS